MNETFKEKYKTSDIVVNNDFEWAMANFIASNVYAGGSRLTHVRRGVRSGKKQYTYPIHITINVNADSCRVGWNNTPYVTPKHGGKTYSYSEFVKDAQIKKHMSKNDKIKMYMLLKGEEHTPEKIVEKGKLSDDFLRKRFDKFKNKLIERSK